MASEVDICNLALSCIGDNATVSSISPPEGSAQAEHCARFYPMARDSLLDMASWNFTMRRVALAQLTMVWPEWKYAYAIPSDTLNIISIISATAADDYSTRSIPTDGAYYSGNYAPPISAGQYTPQPYTVETQADGSSVLFTNCEGAVMRYSSFVTDTAQFTPLFVMALSWHLASMLAGPIIKGAEGAAESKRCVQIMSGYLAKANASDANQRKITVEHIVPWSAGR
jgi:hypothetical protein